MALEQIDYTDLPLDFMQLYKDFIKKSGGQNTAKTKVLNWLEKERKTPLVNLSPNVRKDNGRMEAGKIYIFKYDPKTKDELAYYDKNPVILSMGPSQKYQNLDLGINLNYLPLKYKLYVLDMVYKYQINAIRRSRAIYKKVILSGKTPNPKRDELSSRFWYKVAKKIIKDELKFAIRSYYVDRRSKSIVVSYNKWPEVALLDISDMEKITLKEVYAIWMRIQKAKKIKKITGK